MKTLVVLALSLVLSGCVVTGGGRVSPLYQHDRYSDIHNYDYHPSYGTPRYDNRLNMYFIIRDNRKHYMPRGWRPMDRSHRWEDRRDRRDNRREDHYDNRR